MPVLKGTVVYADRRQSRSGGRYWRVGLKARDGRTVFLNARSFSGRLGQECEVEVSQAELERVMADLREAGVEAGQSPEALRDLRIARSVALQAAVAFVASRPQESWDTTRILDLAWEFLNWLSTAQPVVAQEEPDEAPPEPEEEVIQL